MTWMAPFPTRVTAMPAHWVEASHERRCDGTHRAVCGTWVRPQRGMDAEYGSPRPDCTTCAAAAPYPYPGGADPSDDRPELPAGAGDAPTPALAASLARPGLYRHDDNHLSWLDADGSRLHVDWTATWDDEWSCHVRYLHIAGHRMAPADARDIAQAIRWIGGALADATRVEVDAQRTWNPACPGFTGPR